MGIFIITLSSSNACVRHVPNKFVNGIIRSPGLKFFTFEPHSSISATPSLPAIAGNFGQSGYFPVLVYEQINVSIP